MIDRRSFVIGMCGGIISFTSAQMVHLSLIMFVFKDSSIISDQIINHFVSIPLFFIIFLIFLIFYNDFSKNYEIKKKHVREVKKK